MSGRLRRSALRIVQVAAARLDVTRRLTGAYTEIIIETPPAHLSPWLHVDLAQLGLPTEAVSAT